MTRSRRLVVAVATSALASCLAASAPQAAPERARRLEDVYIECEIPVPRVLFVTGRDQRRFLDFQHRRCLEASLQADRKAQAASWVRVVGNRSTSGGKEAAR